jgi:hypothetical protein
MHAQRAETPLDELDGTDPTPAAAAGGADWRWVTVRMRVEESEALDRAAARLSRSRSGQVRHYLIEGLGRDGFLPPREGGR